MDLLATVIGNAVADPEFRARLLDDPRGALDEWGFRLTKGEVRMLDVIFTSDKKKVLMDKFDELQDALLHGLGKELMCNVVRCPGFGCYPPLSRHELRKELDELRLKLVG